MAILDFKRCMVVIDKKFGNPERGRLQTVGIGKAVYDISVPNVVGMSLATVESTLTTAKLALNAFGDTSVNSTSQSPVATTMVPEGASVSVLFGPFPELVVNGTFNTDLSSWTDLSEAPSQVLWNATAKAMLRGMSDGTYARIQQLINIPLPSLNKRFQASFIASSLNIGVNYSANLSIGTIANPKKYYVENINSSGLFTSIFEPEQLGIVVTLELTGNGSSVLIDDVSLKRIDY